MGSVEFIENIVKWFEFQKGVNGVLLLGSYARGEANPDSDIDLLVLVDDVCRWVSDQTWATQFGTIERSAIEDWGVVTSLRCFYELSYEVEFGFAPGLLGSNQGGRQWNRKGGKGGSKNTLRPLQVP